MILLWTKNKRIFNHFYHWKSVAPSVFNFSFSRTQWHNFRKYSILRVLLIRSQSDQSIRLVYESKSGHLRSSTKSLFFTAIFYTWTDTIRWTKQCKNFKNSVEDGMNYINGYKIGCKKHDNFFNHNSMNENNGLLLLMLWLINKIKKKINHNFVAKMNTWSIMCI